MKKYSRVVEFLNSQLEEFQAEEQEKLSQVWKEKETLIKDILLKFSIIYEAHVLKKPGEFNTALDNACSVSQDSSLPDIEPNEPDVFNPEAVLFCLKEMLKPHYSPPIENFTGIQAHLTALWVFYRVLPHISPKPFPLSVVMRLDLAFIKLYAVAEVFSITMIEQGKQQDDNYNRPKKAIQKQQATKQRYNELINEALKHIDKDIKTKNKKTMAIQYYIIDKYGIDETPSFNTIYGRL